MLRVCRIKWKLLHSITNTGLVIAPLDGLDFMLFRLCFTTGVEGGRKLTLEIICISRLLCSLIDIRTS